MRYPPSGYEPIDRDILIAQAKQHARCLRRQAVPDFWESVYSNYAKAARSLSRFLSWLERHHHSRAPLCEDGSKAKAV